MCGYAPGSIHDSNLAVWGGLYDNVDAVYQIFGLKCCVDSAFNAESSAILKSGRDFTLIIFLKYK